MPRQYIEGSRVKRRLGRRYRGFQVWSFRFHACRFALLRALGLAPAPFRLALCMCFKNSATYLREWIEFHLRVGVEHFFLYNNNSEDDFLPVLRPFIDRGLVTLVTWPGQQQQLPIYDHCLRVFGPRARWIGFIDDDEFLFPVEAPSLPEVLRDYEAHAGLLVTRILFGSSGHARRPPGGVLENFLLRAPDGHFDLAKSIVQPARVIGFRNPHAVLPRPGRAIVDENLVVCSEARRSSSSSPDARRLRINHYECKSDEELQAKVDRGDALKGGRHSYHPDRKRGRRIAAANAVRDTAILRFLPALHPAPGPAPAPPSDESGLPA